MTLMTLNRKIKLVALNVLGFLSIFFALALLRAPLLINSDYLLNADEALMAHEILDLYNGGPIFFYYSETTYFGIFNGLAAIPFFSFLGVGALAFKLPATFFYAMFILSSYWLTKKINPKAALTVVLLMLFTSPAVWRLTSLNYGIGLICFLGNLIFLSLIKVKETRGSELIYVFILGFLTGFAIYSFTYSIVYIGSAIILFCLSNNYWKSFRNKASIKGIMSWLIKKRKGRQKYAKFLDGIILVFIPIILFSYIFGGFGIDIAKYSILQSNELHKPLKQLLIIIFLRILLFRKDLVEIYDSTKYLMLSTKPLIRRSIFLGLLGFIIGISPRIWCIATGQITKGGQGFDVDFAPTNMAYHIWQLATHFIPEVLGLREPIIQLFKIEIQFYYLLNAFLVLIILFLLSKAVIFFLVPRREEIKRIMKLESLVFNPAQYFLILPILICAAVTVSQGPPAPRYLFPLQGVISIWTALYLEKVRNDSKILFVLALTTWCLFSSVWIYKYYLKIGIVNNSSIVKKTSPYNNVIEYCKENNIYHAYSDYSTSIVSTFLSKGEVTIAEYSKKVFLQKLKRELDTEKKFSIQIVTQTLLKL